MSSIFEKVDTFIQRLHDLYYVIDPKAAEIIYSSEGKPSHSLTDKLALTLEEYEENKDNENVGLIRAHIALLWINRAFLNGVVHEGQGLARKLDECQEKNIQLEGELEKLSVEYLRLQELTNRINLLDDDNDLERAK